MVWTLDILSFLKLFSIFNVLFNVCFSYPYSDIAIQHLLFEKTHVPVIVHFATAILNIEKAGNKFLT